MTALRARDALPSRRAARGAFERAGARFADASVVHDETRQKLLSRLEFTCIDPERIVDLGCAHGGGASALAGRFPGARVLAVDTSTAMLAAARRRCGAVAEWLCADAECLPLPARAAGLVFANMLLPWCRPERLFAETARILDVSGLFVFSTLGPDSLEQLRRAWAGADDSIHVHGFFDMHDLGDLLVGAGLAEPVLDVDRIQLTYADVRSLVADLRATGGINVAAGRRRGLTGRGRWEAFEQAMLSTRRGGRFAVTLELIFGQAWGRAPAPERGGPPGEFAVPIQRIRRRSG
jgi:malonyl-CoA O-methyltransferase